jgi:hypothetical protein
MGEDSSSPGSSTKQNSLLELSPDSNCLPEYETRSELNLPIYFAELSSFDQPQAGSVSGCQSHVFLHDEYTSNSHLVDDDTYNLCPWQLQNANRNVDAAAGVGYLTFGESDQQVSTRCADQTLLSSSGLIDLLRIEYDVGQSYSLEEILLAGIRTISKETSKQQRDEIFEPRMNTRTQSNLYNNNFPDPFHF